MMILLNPRAAGGTAPDKWRRVSAVLPPFHEKIELRFLDAQTDVDEIVEAAAMQGELHYAAAGGDGTVNTVVSALMRLPEGVRGRVVFGAVGLGSSNDFHKPIDAGHAIEGIPVRMNFARPTRRDVVRVKTGYNGQSSVHYFLINASVGVTAEGNALFNKPDSLLSWLKMHTTPLAILYAALRALAFHQNRLLSIESPGRPARRLRLTNLGIVKNPHFSGSLRYHTPAHYDDGSMGVFVAEEMNLLERIRLFGALSYGDFSRLAKTHAWQSSQLTIAASSCFPLELDGEIHQTSRAEFSVLQGILQVCS
jgi:diacylglycerol kinase family enzyme